MLPVIFVGNRLHAIIRKIACDRAGIPFTHIPIEIHHPGGVTKLLSKLDKTKPSVIIVQEFKTDMFAALADVIAWNHSHTCIRYGDEHMSKQLIQKLDKTPYIHSKTSNEDFARLLTHVFSHRQIHDLSRLFKDGFIGSMMCSHPPLKELLLYYHKIWPSCACFIETDFSNHEKKTLSTKDINIISRIGLEKPEKDPEWMNPYTRAFYAAQVAMRILAKETKRSYTSVFCQATGLRPDVLKYWNKWEKFSHQYVPKNHNIGWPAKEISDPHGWDGGFVEEFWLFGIFIETRTTTREGTEVKSNGGLSYDAIVQNKTASEMAEALLSSLLDREDYGAFKECLKLVTAFLGKGRLVVKRFEKALRTIEAAEALVDRAPL